MVKNLKISSLLAVTLSLLALLLAVVGASGVHGIRATNDALADASDNVPTVVAVLVQQEDVARARLRLDRLAATDEQKERSETLRSAQALIAESERAWEKYRAYPAGDDERALARDVERGRVQLMTSGIKPLMAALRASDQQTAESLAFSKIPQLYSAFSDATARLTQFQVDDSNRLAAEGRAHERTTLMVTCVATLLGLCCALASWLTLKRAISEPLAIATQHFGAMERGDLSGDIRAMRDDELGALLKSLARMQASLRKTVATICVGVEHVVHAAGEIASGTNDLSRRTERQAASLEQTAASMEELTATVRNNAANASEASSLSRDLVATAKVGFDAVRRLAGTMREVKDGSNEIAEITSVIEGIAFQTNILALNAAVEAARAGEQGRGFAVVATEVRALAQRSGVAAKAIKDLIAASVSRAEAGGKQAVDASQRMDEMLQGIDRVTTLLGQIATASLEQTHGIEQVTAAISDMDDVTQRNATLVEQAAAACGSLNEQAVKMEQVIAGFRTDASELHLLGSN